MVRAFPNAVVHTSLYDPEGTFPEFRDVEIKLTPINRVPLLRAKHRAALPLLPWAMKQIDVGDVDVVLASSSGWAHGVQADVPVVVYCHNPPRWLYQPEDYRLGLALPHRVALRGMSRRLQRWDSWAADRASIYLSNSRQVQNRVLQAYGRESEVLPPPVSFNPDGPQAPVPGIEPGFLLTVGRPRGYKATHLIADAIGMLPQERLVVVGGRAAEIAEQPNVTFVNRVPDEQLRWLYANAAGLIAMSREDFGLTPPEANSLGVPALVLRAGGYLETTLEGVSGMFVDTLDPAALAQAIVRFRSVPWNPDMIRAHARQFCEDAFATRLRQVVEDAANPTIVLPDS
jgi:glycosyltransferase involved in cell wall biosynthesis